MPKFHVNPATGEAGRCKSEAGRCPFGTLEEHHDSLGAAREAYESSMKHAVLPPKKRKRVLALGMVALTATISLSGCDLNSISAPQVGVPQAPQSQRGQSSPGSSQDASKNAQELLQQLSKLPVNNNGTEAGYSRASFISDAQWEAAKQDTYKRSFVSISLNSKGQVAKGTLAPDPYTGKNLDYVRGGKATVDIDHVVSLGDAYRSGMVNQSSDQRHKLATDPDNLVAVNSSDNRSKGDKNAAEWLPSNTAYTCIYVSKQITVKVRYSLSVTSAEKAALSNAVVTYCK